MNANTYTPNLTVTAFRSKYSINYLYAILWYALSAKSVPKLTFIFLTTKLVVIFKFVSLMPRIASPMHTYIHTFVFTAFPQFSLIYKIICSQHFECLTSNFISQSVNGKINLFPVWCAQHPNAMQTSL